MREALKYRPHRLCTTDPLNQLVSDVPRVQRRKDKHVGSSGDSTGW